MRKIFLFVAIFGSLLLLNVNTAKAEKADLPEEAVTREASKPLDIGNTVCPVSGEEISEETKASYEYKGKIYNFCCSMCIDTFKNDPEKYIRKIESQQQEEEVEEGMEEPPEMQGHEGYPHMQD